MMTASSQIQFIRRANRVLFGLCILAAVIYGDVELGGGLVFGALLSALNFELLVGIVGVLGADQSPPKFFVGRVILKFLGLMGSSAFLLMVVSFNAISFAAGFSITFISMGLGGLTQLVSGSPSRPESSDA